jgi:hypothetical protein
MSGKFEKQIEASGGNGCGKAAPWKSPQNGLFHLAWKSAKTADFHFPTAPAATDVFHPEGRGTEKPNRDSSKLTYCNEKMVLTSGSATPTISRGRLVINTVVLPWSQSMRIARTSTRYPFSRESSSSIRQSRSVASP